MACARGMWMRNLLPVLTVVAGILALWYAFAVWMNAQWAYDQAARADKEISLSEMVVDTMGQERPVLPAPHQVFSELKKLTWDMAVRGRALSKRSLIWHGILTLSATALGFAIGTVLGIGLAVGIVQSRVMDFSVMPWAIASQMIPIVALAPMIVVVLNSIGLQGLVPKAVISAYLSFFPVVVGMVKGLRAPSPLDVDLLRTYGARGGQMMWKLRVPSSLPFLFASLKIGIAASLVGAIVGELPLAAEGGLGARMLTGTYYGQTIQIWAALFVAAVLAAGLVGLMGLIQRLVLARTGQAL